MRRAGLSKAIAFPSKLSIVHAALDFTWSAWLNYNNFCCSFNRSNWAMALRHHDTTALRKYLWIPIFQTLNPFFVIWGCLLKKYFFSKIDLFLQEVFETNLDLSRHPQQVFFYFFGHFFWFFSPKKPFYSWGVKTALFKISQIFDENPWRNKSSKLDIFGPLFLKTHSALGSSHFLE